MTASYNSDVTITIEAAFGYDPLATPTWTDITAYARGFTIHRGRNRVLDEMQAGKAQVVLSNTDSRFDPAHTGGAYYPNVNVFTPVRIRATYNAVTYDLYRGFAEGWPQTYPGMKDSVVVLPCVDGFRLLAMYETELTESQELSGTRIGNLLDAAGWPAGWRDVDTGGHNVQALTAEFNSILGEIKRTVLVENGLFWIAGDGNATFRDGNTRIEDDTIQATFSDDGSDVGYSAIQVDYDDTQTWNKATVTRVDGSATSASSASSISLYGQRDLHLSETLHVADGEAAALADWLVAEHRGVRLRVSQVALKPEEDPTVLWPKALGLDFWDKVNVERTPPSGTTVDVDCYVEGVSHSVSMVGARSWVTAFQLSPDLPYSDWWVLGTSQLGTDTRLGY